MMYIFMAILAGVCIVIARLVNFKLADQIGVFQSTLFNYIVGLSVSIFFLLLSGEQFLLGAEVFKSIPLWAYLGGIVGVVVVALQIFLTSKISVFYLTLFLFLGQLIIGAIMDYITLGEFSVGKVIGGGLVLIGMIFNLRIDSLQQQPKSVENKVLGDGHDNLGITFTHTQKQ